MLAALHCFWALMIAPPTIWACRRLPRAWLHRLGLGLALLGLLATVGVLAWDLSRFLAESPEYWRYVGQRILFVLATTVNVPLVQLTLAGIVCWRARGK